MGRCSSSKWHSSLIGGGINSAPCNIIVTPGAEGQPGNVGPQGPPGAAGQFDYCAFLPVNTNSIANTRFPLFQPTANVVIVDDGNGATLLAALAVANNTTVLVSNGPYTIATPMVFTADNVWVVADPPDQSVEIVLVAPVAITMANIIALQNIAFIGLTLRNNAGLARNFNVLEYNGGASGYVYRNHLTYGPDNVVTGAQAGVCLDVNHNTGSLVATAVLALENIADGFQKVGIRVNRGNGPLGGNTIGLILNNVVTGAGPTPITAQIGIQFGRQAEGLVSGNTVSGCHFTGPDVAAAGILLFQLYNDNVTVQFNTCFENGYNLSSNDCTSIVIQGNEVTNSFVAGLIVEGWINAPVNASENYPVKIIQNVAMNNTIVDLWDATTGFASAYTANYWLCNTAETDNLDGMLVASRSPFPPGPLPYPPDMVALVYNLLPVVVVEFPNRYTVPMPTLVL